MIHYIYNKRKKKENMITYLTLERNKLRKYIKNGNLKCQIKKHNS